MSRDTGRCPPDPGLRPFGAEPAAQSQAEPLVPNAARLAAMMHAYHAIPSRDFHLEYPEHEKATRRLMATGLYSGMSDASFQFFLEYASGIEAATADETRSGSAVGESPVPAGQTPNLSPSPSERGE